MAGLPSLNSSFLLCILLAVVDSQILSDDVDDRRPLMRRDEDASTAVHLSPSGEFVAVHAHQVRQKVDVEGGTVVQPAKKDKCWYSYVLGKEDTNTCMLSSHSLVMNMQDCAFAASQANACRGPCASTTGNDFDIGVNEDGTPRIDRTGPEGRLMSHPLGCFKSKTAPSSAPEFYFNPGQEAPTNPERGGGIPVCQRDRWINGTENSNGGCPSDGPESYEPIHDNETCKTAAICQSFGLLDADFFVGIAGSGNDMRPDWMKQRDNKPNGCFLRLKNADGTDDGNVYFNTVNTTPPAAPIKGIPLCEILRYSEAAS